MNKEGMRMKKTEKQVCILKLMVIALNEAIKSGHFDLNGRSADDRTKNRHGYHELIIAGRRTIINWFDLGYDELRISVWWNYQPEMIPAKSKRFVESFPPRYSMPQVYRPFFKYILWACGSCHFERRTGKFIYGKEGSQFFDIYINENATFYLDEIPSEEPQGYSTHRFIQNSN
ncbi:MAG TPA: hypothetical protein ACHBZ9_16260 [Arsenophonus nasoniae]|uniref:hypothetical protein n=1 Tax=Arsenophonus nasoniae TaxID=638 RepID=UPI0038797A3C